MVKVIASSLRKGNVVDIDGKLYVVADGREHPSRQGHAGDPARHAPDRRRGEGLRALQDHRAGRARLRRGPQAQYLYQDGDGFHFMNPETYEQVVVPEDMIGDQAAYLQPEMGVTDQPARRHTGRDRAAAARRPRSGGDRAHDQGPDGVAPPTSPRSSPTACAPWCRRYVTTGTKIVVMTADGTYVERAKE